MKEKDYFISRMFRRLLFPSLISSLGFALADMMDAIVLGQRMGETGLAATSLSLPLFMLINAVMDGLGIGGSVRFSQKLGEGQVDAAVRCFNRIIYAAALIGIGMGLMSNLFLQQLLAILGTTPQDGMLYEACGTYVRIIMAGSPVLMLNVILSTFLRNDNGERMASAGFLIGNLTDFSLNILLVLVLDFGTAGAAWSTVIGSAVAIVCYLPGILKKQNLLRFMRTSLDIKETFSCFQIGFSTSVQNLFRLIFFLLVNRLLMALSSENGVAIFNVVYSASFLILYLFNGTAEAAQPLISTFSGENSNEDARHVRALALWWGLLVGGAAALLVFACAGPICRIFGLEESLVPDGVRALRIFCLGAEFTGINILLENYYQAKEEVAPAFVITSLRNFFLLIPCTLLLAYLGVEWIWYMYPVTEGLTLAAFGLFRSVIVPKQNILDAGRRLRMTIYSEEEMGDVLGKVVAFCERWHAEPRQGNFVTMAVEEIAMAIFQKAIGQKGDGRIRVTLVAQTDGDFELHFIDNAVKFDPFSLKYNKMRIQKFEDFDINAVGMTIIRKKAKEFMYRQCQGFNSLIVRIGK